MKFVNHRWLENGPVIERIIGLVPALKLYVNAVDQGKYSYNVVRLALKDKLLVVKLYFLQSFDSKETSIHQKI